MRTIGNMVSGKDHIVEEFIGTFTKLREQLDSDAKVAARIKLFRIADQIETIGMGVLRLYL